MTSSLARQVVREVAKVYGLDPLRIVAPCGRASHPALYARIEVAKRLRARGYSMPRIATILNRHHTTILYYLFEAPKPRWHRPRIMYLNTFRMSVEQWERHCDDRCRKVPEDRRYAENARREIRSRTGAAEAGARGGQEAQA